MPIYNYKCASCGEGFEKLTTVAQADKPCGEPCSACGCETIQRCISIPAVHMRYSPMHPRHMRGQRRARK